MAQKRPPTMVMNVARAETRIAPSRTPSVRVEAFHPSKEWFFQNPVAIVIFVDIARFKTIWRTEKIATSNFGPQNGVIWTAPEISTTSSELPLHRLDNKALDEGHEISASPMHMFWPQKQ